MRFFHLQFNSILLWAGRHRTRIAECGAYYKGLSALSAVGGAASGTEVLAVSENEGVDLLDEQALHAEIADEDLESAIADDEIPVADLAVEAEPDLDIEMPNVAEPASAAALVEFDGRAIPLAEDGDLELATEGEAITDPIPEPGAGTPIAPADETAVELIPEDGEAVDLQPETKSPPNLDDAEPDDLFDHDNLDLSEGLD